MQALQTDVPYVVYDAPLLVETGAHKSMAALIVVAASPEVQVTRVMARDGLTQSEARARLAAQAPLAAKLAAADYVIQNDGSLSELQQQVAELHETLCKRFAHPTATPAEAEP